MNSETKALSNFKMFSENRYFGRGIMLGVTATGQLIQLCFVSGRSNNTRNRVYVERDGLLYAEIADPYRFNDPEHIGNYEYPAMAGDYINFVVSNGLQTTLVLRGLGSLVTTMPQALAVGRYSYENDSSSTPRITGAWRLGSMKPLAEMVILRRSLWGDDTDVSHYRFGDIAPGYGFLMTTYAEDGNPPPPFRGDPILMPLLGTSEEILKNFWNGLNRERRVSMAVKEINPRNGQARILPPINKYIGADCVPA